MKGAPEKSTRVGVLAEDSSDCDVIEVLIGRMRKGVSVKPFGAKGASMLKRKLRSRIMTMRSQGCSAFIVVHDLDRNEMGKLNDKEALKRDLEKIVNSTGAELSWICIPVEELEAWFWSDQAVLDRVAGDNPGKAHHHPHMIDDPKGKLKALSSKNGKTTYTTNDNKALAQILDMSLCAQRCLEFAELRDFVQRL